MAKTKRKEHRYENSRGLGMGAGLGGLTEPVYNSRGEKISESRGQYNQIMADEYGMSGNSSPTTRFANGPKARNYANGGCVKPNGKYR